MAGKEQPPQRGWRLFFLPVVFGILAIVLKPLFEDDASPPASPTALMAPAPATSSESVPGSDDAVAAAQLPATDPDTSLLQRWQQSSLRGAEVDGGVRLDAAGHLQVDLDLRRLFEHFLSLSGEFSDGEIRRLLQLHVVDAHGAAVADEVITMFDRYLGMRNAAAALPPETDIAARFEALRQLRREWLGNAAAEAMFGADEAHTAYTLERMAVLEDPELRAEERAIRLAELDESRPQAAQEGQQSALSALLAEEQTRQLDALGIDDAERHAERSALWGEDAADRLATLDQERAQWDRRLADYVRQRDQLANDARLDTTARAAAIEALRRRSFADNERVRVESLEAVSAMPPGG